MDDENFATSIQADAVKAQMRHMRNAMEDENYKPKRPLDEVEKEQLARIAAGPDKEEAEVKAAASGDGKKAKDSGDGKS
jgi:predicted phage gp36 major capsid-like protein